MNRAAIVFSILTVGAPGTTSAVAVTIEPVEAWSNVYGDTVVARRFTVKTERAVAGRFTWGLVLDGRTVLRGEQEVRAAPERAATVLLRLNVPAVREGVILTARLTVAVLDPAGGAPMAQLEQPLVIFPQDPFAEREAWLKGLKLGLFDPAGATALVFEKAAIPFEALREPGAIEARTEGVIVVGEGVSWDEERGLADAVVLAAARGRPVLCLAPAAGRLALPGLGDPPLAAPRRLSWRRNDVIAALDKRLDASAWPPDGQVVARSLVARAEGGELVATVAEGSAGWPWFEAGFAEGRGRLIVCGFGIVAHWEASPTPRYLLERIFNHVSEDPKVQAERSERTEQ